MALAPSRPALKLKTVTKIPARVVSGPGISQSLAGGLLTTSLDFATLVDNAGVVDPADYTTVILNTTTGEYEEAPLSQLNIPTVAAVRTARGDANYVILSTDRYIGLTASLTAPRTWTLPTAAGVIGGTIIRIRDEVGGIGSTNTLTINCTGAELINGAASLVLNSAWAGVDLISDGTSAWTVGTVLLPSAALSVVGRATNTAGNAADITAGTSGHVLRRSGTTLGFGQIDDTSIADGSVTTAKLAGLAVTTAKIADANVTVAKLETSAQQGLCKSWVSFNGAGTISIRDSFNVSSISDNGAGDYSVNITTAFPSVNYGVTIGVGGTSGVVASRCLDDSTARTTGQYRFNALNTSFAAADATQIAAVTFGD